MLLSSSPRSCTSRLAWLSQTPIAVASGRINQNCVFVASHTCSAYWRVLDRCPHHQYSSVESAVLPCNSDSDSHLKRPLMLVSQRYIPSQAHTPVKHFKSRFTRSLTTVGYNSGSQRHIRISHAPGFFKPSSRIDTRLTRVR